MPCKICKFFTSVDGRRCCFIKQLPLLPRSLSDPTTPVWNSELLHLPWVTGGFQWWTPRQSASPRGNRWALLLGSWVSKRSNWPDHEGVRSVWNFSKFAGRPIKKPFETELSFTARRSNLSRNFASQQPIPIFHRCYQPTCGSSSKLPIPFGQNLHSGPFRHWKWLLPPSRCTRMCHVG